MRRAAAAVGLVSAVAACVADVPAETMLAARIEVVGAAPAGGPVVLRYTLENRSDARVHVLDWHTPLEGFRSDLFEVTRDGEPVAYAGPMVKRGAPRADDYVTLAAGAAVSAEVDLARAYDLSLPGTYMVRPRGPLRDVAPDGAALPRPPERREPRDAPCAPLTVTVGGT